MWPNMCGKAVWGKDAYGRDAYETFYLTTPRVAFQRPHLEADTQPIITFVGYLHGDHAYQQRSVLATSFHACLFSSVYTDKYFILFSHSYKNE